MGDNSFLYIALCATRVVLVSGKYQANIDKRCINRTELEEVGSLGQEVDEFKMVVRHSVIRRYSYDTACNECACRILTSLS